MNAAAAIAVAPSPSAPPAASASLVGGEPRAPVRWRGAERNKPCACGLGRKYKRCCLAHDQAVRRHQISAALPAWLVEPTGRLAQFEKYACQVFALPDALQALTDQRRDPAIPTFDVVNSLFHTALLRIPSINALEGDLKEADFQRLIGRAPTPSLKVFSADVVANVLDKLDLGKLTQAMEDVVWRAERNKAFREGSYGALRCVAIDGWEAFASYHRHCADCLVRRVHRKTATGEVEEVEQYYHAYVVAMLLGPVLDLVLAIEPIRNDEAQHDSEAGHAGHEGELTAAHRLIDRLHDTYGTFIDALVFDALYANGPVMRHLDRHGYGGFIVLKKDDNQPLTEALALWAGQAPCDVSDGAGGKEHIEYWDLDDVTTLETYPGALRVIRAVITKTGHPPRTWAFAIVGRRARRVSRATALRIVRGRWHLEDTAFHQWVKHWHFGHVFRHTPNAVSAVLLLWIWAFNLLQLFVYRRLGRTRRPADPTDTIRHLVEVMLRELACLPAPIPWAAFFDTS